VKATLLTFLILTSSVDDWTETIFNYGSFFTSLTSYLPLQSGTSGGDDIVAIASHPWPTDLGHLWTLSRDRTLRLWKAKVGCVSSKNLSSLKGTFSASPGSSSNNVKQLLLDPSPRSLLKVFSHNERAYVMAFIPTVPATSGGVFKLFDTYGDYLHDVTTFDCPQHTIHSYLQDFIIHEDVLYTLWERQGRSAIELAELHLGQGEDEEFQPSWRVAAYVNEPDLTPAYLEEQLLTHGSLTEKYLEALLRPGVFSSLTLKTAIDQYTDMCLSLPSAPPPQLTTVYATVEEQIAGVVGCTVNLNRDPQTGAAQHAAYWVALKRDWEGFIARCREIERSARWPLALGIKDHDGVAIMERERIGLLVNEDLPIQLQRLSLRNAILDPQYELLAILWKLRSKVGPQAISTIQDRIIDILHQEIAFGFSDIIQDQAKRIGFQDALPDGQTEWFAGRLESVGDLDAAVRTALDVIGGVDDVVKREDDEMTTLIIPENPSDLSTGLTVAYILTTISARYDLCLSLMILLFFIADDLLTWDPSLLAEVFAVFRGISMLRQISSQPVRPPNRQETQPTERAGSEDVVLRMRNMNFSNGGSVLAPGFSLVHLLLLQVEARSHPPGAAHHFLDTTGLLRSVSPSNATKHEVLFCERIRLLGLHDVARSLLAWLPRTPGAVFVLALVWLQLGRPSDSAELLEKLASSFGNVFVLL
jgi:nuclear pore complex protein Nup160